MNYSCLTPETRNYTTTGIRNVLNRTIKDWRDGCGFSFLCVVCEETERRETHHGAQITDTAGYRGDAFIVDLYKVWRMAIHLGVSTQFSVRTLARSVSNDQRYFCAILAWWTHA